MLTSAWLPTEKIPWMQEGEENNKSGRRPNKEKLSPPSPPSYSAFPQREHPLWTKERVSQASRASQARRLSLLSHKDSAKLPHQSRSAGHYTTETCRESFIQRCSKIGTSRPQRKRLGLKPLSHFTQRIRKIPLYLWLL